MSEIAVIGVACRFPGASDYDRFWSVLEGARDAIGEIQPDRWDGRPARADAEASSELPRWAGLTDDVESFDHRFFSISPREAAQMDPQQRMLLEESWHCIEDSGVSIEELQQARTAVYVGAMTSDFLQKVSAERNPESHSALGTYHCMLANRVSHLFGFRGPSFSVDAGHAASLVAIHQAVQALESGDAEYALVAGVNAILDSWKHESFSKARMLSPDGVCRAFDKDANGYVPGEGCGVVLLQRMADARRERSSVRGVIRGSAVNHSGSTVSITAPSVEAQQDVIEEALRAAEVDPAEITYVEAHGTGTPLGDPAEIAALANIFRERDRSSPCRVGSVKTNIGHLEAASGIAGLIKVLLMMEHRLIPKSLNVETVNPVFDLDGSRIAIAREAVKWRAGRTRRLLAGISSFGFGGVNAHVVLQSAPPRRARTAKQRRGMPFLLSARSSTALAAMIDRWRELVRSEAFENLDLEDVCGTLSKRRQFPHRFAAVVRTSSQIAEALDDPTRETMARGKAGLLKAVRAWRSGEEVDWEPFVGSRWRRVALPAYPFDHDVDRGQEQEVAAPSGDPLADTAARLRSILSAKLGCDPAEIGDSDGFVEVLGIDSFINVEIVETLEQDLGPLPRTLLFEHSTIEKLAAHLVESFGGLVLGGSDQDESPAPSRPEECEEPKKTAAHVAERRGNDVAIIGIAGRFPGASSLDELWNRLVAGDSCITEWPAERWNDDWFDPEGNGKDRSYTRWGGFLDDYDCFDPLFFNITPKQAELMDPQQRIFLETAWAAMENAGCTPRALPRNTGVFAGVSTNTYGLWAAQEALKGNPLGPDTDPSDVANRVSYFLDLHGPSISLDTACSSSITAVHLAARSLAAGECEVAFAGAVNLTLHPQRILQFCRKEMLSRSSFCHPFGEGPGGFVDGEGVCVVLLKPLDRAIADGDFIHAVIKGTAINSEGRTSGYTVPSPERQADLIGKALDAAGVDPRTISYVEAHGTGTRLGDPIEIEGLTRAFRRSTEQKQFCAIGSVKSNIGHLIAAAGMAGLAKVVLQLEHETLVPSLHAESLNPYIEFDRTPFRVQREVAAWKRVESSPLRAAVSSFGSGGANGHLIVEEYRDEREHSDFAGPFVVPISARSEERLRVLAENLADWLTLHDEVALADVAWTLQTGREAMDARAVFIVDDRRELIDRLHRFSVGRWKTERWLPEIASRWLEGERVTWDALYPGRTPRRIPMPTYPFLMERYWLPGVVRKTGERMSTLGKPRTSSAHGFAVSWAAEPLPEQIPRGMSRELVLSPDSQDDYEVVLGSALQEADPPTHLILPVAGIRNDDPLRALRSVHALIRAIDAAGWRRDVEVVVAFGSDGPTIRPDAAAVDALLHSASLETSFLSHRTIVCETSSVSELLELVRNEIEWDSDRRTVRHLGGTRQVRSAEEVDLRDRADLPIGRESVVVVTGGFGVLGLRFAEELTRRYGCRVALIGRHAPNESRRRRLERLESDGAAILPLEADVTDREQLERAIDRAREHFGSIDGVIHAAGVFRLGHAADKSWDEMLETLSPKIDGAVRLDDATSDDSLDFFAMFSSIAALIHGDGLGDYAAANAFLDSFAEWRERLRETGERSGRTISINWPLWAEGGMKIPDAAKDRLLEESGLEPLPASEGLRLFPLMLRTPASQVLVAYGDAERIRSAVQRRFAPDRRRLSFEECLALVRSVVAEEIGIGIDDVDPSTELSLYGLDSVNLRQITLTLETQFETLPKTLLLEHKSVESAARYLSERGRVRTGPEGEEMTGRTRLRYEVSDQRPDEIAARDDIAIVGVTGRYPDAPDLDTFWANLRKGRSSIATVPRGRWSAESIDEIYCRWGAFLEDVDKFDPLLFEITPVEAKMMHPEERLLLESAWTTFENAGYSRDRLRGTSTGVFVGVNSLTYPLLGLDRWRGSSDVSLDSSYYPLPNRISYFFDLDGPSVPVDTGCSSTLVAIHLACESIRNGDCDSALVAAVNLYLHPSKYWLLCRDRMLASDPAGLFKRGGEGFIPGEGVGSVYLKPLGRAISDGDTIHAVIRASAVTHKGRSNGFLAPEPRALMSLFRRALENGDFDPASVSCIEIQATGSEMADAAEWQAIEEVYGGADRCVVGSLKPNIGHLESAAGMAQLAKVLLQMRHGEIAPVRLADALNEGVRPDRESLVVPQRPVPWSGPRRAAITSIAAGGTGAHLIIDDFAEDWSRNIGAPADEIIVLSARSPDQLSESARNLLSHVGRSSQDLGDMAFTLQTGRQPFDHRFAAVVPERGDLVAALERFLDGGESVQTEASRDHSVSEVARSWVAGAKVDWTELPGTRLDRRRVPLPTYPFERRRCWLFDETPEPKSESVEVTDAGAVVADYYNRMTDVIRRQTNGEQDELYILFAPFERRVEGFSWIKSFFEPSERPDHVELMRAKQKEMKEVLYRHVDFHNVRRVFDIGCGLGTDLIHLARAHPSLHADGFTITPRQAELAELRVRRAGLEDRVTIHCADSTKRPFPGRYDLVIGFEVIFHIEDKDAVFANIASHLDEDGLVVLADGVTNTVTEIDLPHLGQYTATPEQFSSVLARHRLVIEDCVDASPEISNFLYDARFEENLTAVNARHPELAPVEDEHRCWDSFGKVLGQKLVRYLLFSIRKAEARHSEAELRAINETRIREAKPYSETAAGLNVPEPGIRKVAASGPAPGGTVEEQVLQLAATVLELEPSSIDPEARFADYGVGSLQGLLILDAVNRHFGIGLKMPVLYDHSSLRELAAHVESLGVTGRASIRVRQIADRPSEDQSGEGAIAVIGMAARFPGAPDAGTFWCNLRDGVDSIREIPPDRWDVSRWYDPDPDRENRSYSRWAGIVDDVDRFDAGFFRISPHDAALMDPQQRLFLEACWTALEDAGCTAESLAGSRCGVYAGVMGNDYADRLAESGRVPEAQTLLGNDDSILASRISYFLNATGPALTIKTACSSSLVAVHLASGALRSGEADLALAGGVTLYLHHRPFVMMSRAGMLSPTGRCRPFDEEADGIAVGDGCGVVLLKRLSDALRDGDRIYGVVRASGVNQDGRTNGITAPSMASQKALEMEVLRKAGIDPGSISYVEAHGTGTKLGDPIEVSALTETFRASTNRRGFCALGSVKSNIGHTTAAAGVAGLIKVLLSIRQGQIPPTLHFRRANHHIDLDDSPFFVNTELREWTSFDGSPLRATVSAFGFSGTNCFLVVDEPPQPAEVAVPMPAEGFMIPLSARTPERLRAYAESLLEFVKSAEHDKPAIEEIAYTLQTGRTRMHSGAALMVRSVEELERGLAELLRGGTALPVPETNQPWPVKPRKISLPTYPFERNRYWYGPVDRSDESPEESLAPDRVALFVPSWRDAATREGEIPEDSRVLVFENDSRISSGLRTSGVREVVSIRPGNAFERISEGEFTIRPAEQADLDELVRLAGDSGRSPSHVVHAWPQEIASPIHAAVSLAKALIAKSAWSLRVLSVHHGSPFESAISAFARTANRESSRIRWRSIGVDRLEEVEAILRELGERDGVDIRYESGVRRSRGLEDVASPPVEEIAVRGRNVLISGGTGGIGRIIAGWFAERGANVIVCGRSAPAEPPRDVTFVKADVTRRNDVERLLDRLKQEHGDLHGVVHAAAVLRDSMIIGKTLASIDEVVAPKIQGAIHLDELTRNEPLDFFVLMSSVSGIAGNPGQCDYAYANAFLDRLADERERMRRIGERTGRTLSIAWPLWKDGGMRVSTETAARLRSDLGMIPMPTGTALAVWEKVLASGHPRVIVSHGDGERFRRVVEGEPEVHEQLVAPGESLQKRAEDLLKSVFARHLEVPVEDLDADATFEEYGIDSIMINAFNVSMERLIGSFPRTVLFEYRTIEHLADYFASQHAAQIEQATSGPGTAGDQSSASSVASRSDVVTSSQPSSFSGPDPAQDGIAIIGISGRYPQAPDLDRFWANLESGTDCTSTVPADRWDAVSYADRIYSDRGAFLEDADRFDPLFFGISPREAERMDPQERIFLECAWSTIEDAGHTRETLGRDVGVFVGVTTNSYALWGGDPSHHDHEVPESMFWSIANRVSYFFDFSGPSMPVDTACSASLTAIHLACESLRKGECSVALAGGVNLYLHPAKLAHLCQLSMLSRNGRCSPFGDDADGFVPGEGVGAVLLKPLRRAIEDGDRIHAVIRGSAINHGGRTNGYTVPNPQSQAELIRASLASAKLDPSAISYVEAHGTGTALGDPVEIAGLTKAWGGDGHQPCAIGSVKSNIGHLESAAGIAGLTKIVLQMRHGRLVPSLHSEPENHNIDFSSTPFRVQRVVSDWPAPRRATISSFGAGGANANLIVEGYEATARDQASIGPQVFVLSAKSEDRLRERAATLISALRRTGAPASDVAWTLQVGREKMSERLAVVAGDLDELSGRLRSWLDGIEVPGVYRSGSRHLDHDVPGLLRGRDLHGLARAWAEGHDVDWTKLHAGETRRRVSLPTYPFAGKRYWIGGRRAAPATEERFEAALSRETRFTRTIEPDDVWAADHVVGGKKTVVGSLQLELVRQAVEAAGREILEFSSVVWLRPLVIEERARELRVSLDSVENGAVFRLTSHDDRNGSDLVYMQGRVHYGSRPHPAMPVVDVAGVRKRCDRSVSHREFYDVMKGRGIDYGATFRVVQEAFIDGDEVIGRLVLPDTQRNTAEQMWLHPATVDGGLQLITLLLRPSVPVGALVPFSLHSLEIRSPVPAECHAWVTRKGEAYEVMLCDESGRPLVKLGGLSLRSAERRNEPSAEGSGLRDLLRRVEAGKVSAAEAKRLIVRGGGLR